LNGCSTFYRQLSKRKEKNEEANGKADEAKEEGNQEELSKMKKRTVHVTRQHNDDAKRLLRLLGMPVVEAPCEAEAQCAELCKSGKVWAVVTEDMDALTFGSPRLLRHFTFR